MAAAAAASTSKDQRKSNAPQPSIDHLKETMKLISRVMYKCTLEKNNANPISFYKPIKRAVEYTGLHENVITKIRELLGSDSEVVITVTMEEMDPMVIRDELMDFYLNRGIFPTTRQLFSALQNKIPVSVDIGKLRKMLVKMNYMWKYYPKYPLVIVENSVSIFERHHYLKRISEYREEDRPIIFLDVCWLDSKGDLVIMTNPDDRDIAKEGNGYFMYGVSKDDVYGLTVKQATPFSTQVFEEWILEVVCFHVPQNSVIVMNNLKYNNEEVKKIPTLDSLKAEMIEWLEHHNIPCSRSMCKTELFYLVEKFTNHIDKLYKIDAILKFHGHDVLRIPNSIENVTPTFYIRNLVANDYRGTPNQPIDVDQSWDKFESAKVIFENLRKDLLESLDSHIAGVEEDVFGTDIKLDEKYDKLCEDMEARAKENISPGDDEDVDSDLPSMSDSD